MCCTSSLIFPIPLLITVAKGLGRRAKHFGSFGPWVGGLGIQQISVEEFLTTFCCPPSVDSDEVHFALLV